jgi:hypothetical protein
MIGAVKFTVSAHTTASCEDVIDVLSEWKSLPEYWHGMREISQSNGGMFKVRFAFPGEGKMSYFCDQESMYCTENYHSGPFTGFKKIQIYENNNGSTITVKWDIHLSFRLLILKRFLTRHFQQGTENALSRIILEAESRIKVTQ